MEKASTDMRRQRAAPPCCSIGAVCWAHAARSGLGAAARLPRPGPLPHSLPPPPLSSLPPSLGSLARSLSRAALARSLLRRRGCAAARGGGGRTAMARALSLRRRRGRMRRYAPTRIHGWRPRLPPPPSALPPRRFGPLPPAPRKRRVGFAPRDRHASCREPPTQRPPPPSTLLATI